MQKDQKYLIVIFGPPGSGKSTLSHLLYEKLQVQSQIYEKQAKQNDNGFEIRLLSADCIEQYLSKHTLSELMNLIEHENNYDKILSEEHLQRSLFDENIWQMSRNFIKNNIISLFNKNNKNRKTIIIIEDDLLLKSQRKNIRQVVSKQHIKYVQVQIEISLEECLQNITHRNNTLIDPAYHISEQIAKQCYLKMERQISEYQIQVGFDKITEIKHWEILQACKEVIINHQKDEEDQKELIPEENYEKDQVQINIRKFINQVITQPQLHQLYFPNHDTKYVAKTLSRLKKEYMTQKNLKGLQSFQSFVQENQKNKLT